MKTRLVCEWSAVSGKWGAGGGGEIREVSRGQSLLGFVDLGKLFIFSLQSSEKLLESFLFSSADAFILLNSLKKIMVKYV